MPAANDTPVHARIRAAADRGVLSHALLLSGGGEKERLETARFAAAAMECAGEEGRPCGRCGPCRKVRRDIHPDVITVRDPDHRQIAVEVLRNLRQDAWVRPNEGRRKVYLFPDCALLTEQDQNVLLKLVEEGPPYAAFLFCAENPGQVLPTLRSRCVELKLPPGGAEAPGRKERWEQLCRAVGSGRRGETAALAARLEASKSLSREDLAELLEQCRAVFADALLQRYGRPAEQPLAEEAGGKLTVSQLNRIAALLERYHGECAYNVGPGHVLGALAAELEEIL